MTDDQKIYKDHTYPTVNYIGNKEKITEWICENVPKNVNSVFDAFSGGASVGFALKQHGKTVYSNDILRINYLISKALIDNKSDTLSEQDIHSIFTGKPIKGFVYHNYADKLFFQDECMQLDLYRKNIDKLKNPHKQALALVLMRRAMIRKMPYSRFNIKWNKVVQLRDEEYSYLKYKRRRAYHNQSFEHHFRANVNEYNNAIFDNQKNNKSYNLDALEAVKVIKADMVYIDPPYTGTMNNYFDFYSFLDSYVDQKIQAPFKNSFTDKKTTVELFDNLFSSLSNYKYWMLSYNSSAYPTKEILLQLIGKYAKNVKIIQRKHVYKITGKANKDTNTEYLFIAERN